MPSPDMTIIGIGIGTSIVPTLIIVTCLFLLAVPGGASIHGITIPTSVMATDMTRPITHTITRMTIAGIPTTGMVPPHPNRIATTMATHRQASTATQLSAQYSQNSTTLDIITARSMESTETRPKPPLPDTNRIRT